MKTSRVLTLVAAITIVAAPASAMTHSKGAPGFHVTPTTHARAFHATTFRREPLRTGGTIRGGTFETRSRNRGLLLGGLGEHFHVGESLWERSGWATGFWVWREGAWIWYAGQYWASPDYPGWVWVPAQSVWDGNELVWQDAHWATAEQ